MSIKPQAAIVLLLAALAAPAFSQDNWNSLRSLKPGQRIGVVQADGKRLQGTFASFSDAALSIRTDQVTAVPKDSVIRVYRRPRISRGWRVALGAGIGVAGGAVLNATIGQYLRNEAHGTSPAVWIGAGAAVGAGVGALSGGGEHIVYRRRP
jgi:hypothetical protein